MTKSTPSTEIAPVLISIIIVDRPPRDIKHTLDCQRLHVLTIYKHNLAKKDRRPTPTTLLAQCSPHWTIFATCFGGQQHKCSISSSSCENHFSLIPPVERLTNGFESSNTLKFAHCSYSCSYLKMLDIEPRLLMFAQVRIKPREIPINEGHWGSVGILQRSDSFVVSAHVAPNVTC